MATLGFIDLFGLAIVLFVAAEVLILSIVTFSKWGKEKASITAYFANMFLFLFFAVIFLIMEQASFRVFGNDFLGRIFAWVAIFTSASAGIFIGLITFQLTTEHKWRYMIFIFILVATYITVTGLSIFLSDYGTAIFGQPITYVQEGELFYIPPVMVFNYLLIGPILMLAPITFFYYAIVNRDNKPNAIRSFWMGMAILVFAVAYLIEIGPITVWIAVPMRFGYIFAATTLYICFSMPEWFKKIIKWED